MHFENSSSKLVGTSCHVLKITEQNVVGFIIDLMNYAF